MCIETYSAYSLFCIRKCLIRQMPALPLSFIFLNFFPAATIHYPRNIPYDSRPLEMDS